MSKVLILDDMAERHERFRSILSGHEVTHAWTFTQAVKALSSTRFDLACLDHDLGDFAYAEVGGQVVPTWGEVRVDSPNFCLTFSPDFVNDGMYNSSRRFLDGRDVCHWIVEHEFRAPKRVLIHSHNPKGAESMASILGALPAVKVKVLPFKGG